MPLYPILALGGVSSRACDTNLARRGSFIAFKLSKKNFPAALKVGKSTGRPHGDTKGVIPVRFSTAASVLLVKTGYCVGLLTIVLILVNTSRLFFLDNLSNKRR